MHSEGVLHLFANSMTANHELSQNHKLCLPLALRENPCGFVVEETGNGIIMLCMTPFFVNLYDFLTIKSGSVKEKV